MTNIFVRSFVALLSIFFIQCRMLNAQTELSAVRDHLISQYGELELLQLAGRSSTTSPNIADQTASFTYASAPWGYKITREVGNAKFIQTYDGERSQFYQSATSSLEILISARSNYLAYIPHLAALEWLEKKLQKAENRERLRDESMWKDRFADALKISESPSEIVLEFPCPGTMEKSSYFVSFSKELNFAVQKWHFVENQTITRTLQVESHSKLEGLPIHLPTSVSLVAGPLVAESHCHDIRTNSHASLEIDDLRPLAKEVYDEFKVRDHLIHSEQNRKRLSNPVGP